MDERPFRFGIQVRSGSAADLRERAQAAERAGFDVASTFDHLGDNWTPTLPLLAMAAATSRLRVCPMVINNDFHHPVHLAAEYADLDRLTGGRVELGIGAGHAFTEYHAIGQAFDPPAERKARLAEAVEIIRRLVDGETVSFEGEHYRLTGVTGRRAEQDRMPILVGVNGKRALAHAARHADIIGLMMLGKTLADGRSHEVRWETSRLDDTVGCITEQAGERAGELELNALVQVVEITDDREAAAERMCAAAPGLTRRDALETPFLALGTPAQIADHLRACRSRWGISYFTVRTIDDFAPVIDLVRADA